jgi:hypothetical protein
VFREIYIPRTLQELSLEEILKLKQNSSEEVYANLTGLKSEEHGSLIAAKKDENTIEEQKEEESSSSADEEENEEGEVVDEKGKTIKLSDVSIRLVTDR